MNEREQQKKDKNTLRSKQVTLSYHEKDWFEFELFFSKFFELKIQIPSRLSSHKTFSAQSANGLYGFKVSDNAL